jgi:CO/xanthine dehydrogenase FAD-binding subunit
LSRRRQLLGARKVRERASFAFALVSAAVLIDIAGRDCRKLQGFSH